MQKCTNKLYQITRNQSQRVHKVLTTWRAPAKETVTKLSIWSWYRVDTKGISIVSSYCIEHTKRFQRNALFSASMKGNSMATKSSGIAASRKMFQRLFLPNPSDLEGDCTLNWTSLPTREVEKIKLKNVLTHYLNHGALQIKTLAR